MARSKVVAKKKAVPKKGKVSRKKTKTTKKCNETTSKRGNTSPKVPPSKSINNFFKFEKVSTLAITDKEFLEIVEVGEKVSVIPLI